MKEPRYLFILFLLVFSLGSLSACSPVYKTEYQFTPPETAEGIACANNCLDALHSCTGSCQSKETECRYIEDLKSELEYQLYIREQSLLKKAVERKRSSFTNYRHCNTGCKKQCQSSQRICHSNCGGGVAKHRYCSAFCDE